MGQAALKPQDLRRHDRTEYKLEISGDSGHQFFTGFSENISAGGLFIATYQTLPLGTRFQINFAVPGVDYEFATDCEVRWVREYNEDTPDTMPGMGVRFLNLSSRETEVLDELVRRLETMFYID